MDYGEQHIVPEWNRVRELRALFDKMTPDQQAFCNDIRHLYKISQAPRGGNKTDGTIDQTAGLYVFCGHTWW